MSTDAEVLCDGCGGFLAEACDDLFGPDAGSALAAEAAGRDAEGDAFEADGGLAEVEVLAGFLIGHGSEDGDFAGGPAVDGFCGPVGAFAFAEGGDFEVSAFGGDGHGGGTDALGDVAVDIGAEEFEFAICPVVPEFGLACEAFDPELEAFVEDDLVLGVEAAGDFGVREFSEECDLFLGPGDDVARA